MSNQRRMVRSVPERVGSDRMSMRTNPLLIPTELGVVKDPGYSLPNITFGRQTVADDGGAARAVGDWNSANNPRYQRQPRMKRDFVRMNRAAVSAGVCNARELYHYSCHNDFRKRERVGSAPMSDTYPPPGMTHGLRTRPSTPLWNVLDNSYQREWLKSRYNPNDSEMAAEVGPRRGQVYETRASLARRYVEPAEAQPPWHMQRFERVPAHLTTFRHEHTRERSYAAHDLDKVSRRGTIGHGVYATAQT